MRLTEILHKKKNAAAFALFFSFMFVQYVILRMSNSAGRGYLPENRLEYVYYVLQVIVIAGFLLHALTSRSKDRLRRAAFLASLGVCFSGAMLQLFLPTGSLFFLIVTALTVLCLGYIGGYVYLQMSAYASSGARVGICMGGGCACAIALQYVLQLRFTVLPLLYVFVPAAFAVLALLSYAFSRVPAEEQPSRTQPSERVSAAPAFVIVITVAMLLFTCYYNSYIHHLQIASGYAEYNIYTWPRLLMIPTYLIFGLIGDFKKGRFLPLAALCVAVTALLNSALVGKSSAYWLNMSLYYVALSPIVSYYNLTFWRLAPKMKRPALWAPLGRILDSALLLPSLFFNTAELPAAAVLALNIAALAVIVVMMALGGDFNVLQKETPADEPSGGTGASGEERADKTPDQGSDSAENPFAVIGEKHNMTQAEIKVLKELVLTEDKQAVIAERLNVKIRTVQACVTAIYRKTGVSTRSGLVQLYHDALRQK